MVLSNFGEALIPKEAATEQEGYIIEFKGESAGKLKASLDNEIKTAEKMQIITEVRQKEHYS